MHAEGEDTPTRVEAASFTANSYQSDYSVTISYSGLAGNTCDCEQYDRILEAYKSGYFVGATVVSQNYNTSTSGSITKYLGPGYTGYWYFNSRFTGKKQGLAGCLTSIPCDNIQQYSPNILIQTAPLKDPINVQVSNSEASGSLLDRIILTWEKGTDFPTADVGYLIYRDGVLIKTIPLGDETYTFHDTLLDADTYYSYRVATHITRFQGHESDGVLKSGKTTSLNIQVSQGEFADKIKVTWDRVQGAVDNYRIERSIPYPQGGGYEELAILSKHAQAYTDTDPIPGYRYTYKVSPLDANGDPFQTVLGSGYRKPNGILSGQVAASGGAGVPNVSITIRVKNNFPPSRQAAPGVNMGPYTTTTGPDGYYEVRGIYYYDDADFIIEPSFPNHGFVPDKLERTLDENTTQVSGVNFTDTTALSVSGKIVFQDAQLLNGSPGICGLKGAGILVNGLDVGILTDKDGNWSYAVPQPDTFVFKAVYLHHSFDLDSIKIHIEEDQGDINFVNTQIDSVEIRVQGGCGASVTSNQPVSVQIDAFGSPGCSVQTITTNNDGYANILLPATKYTFRVLSTNVNSNALAQYRDTVINLTLRDSTIESRKDTTFQIIPPRTLPNGVFVPGSKNIVSIKDTLLSISLQPRADFIYYLPLEVSIDFMNAQPPVDIVDCNNKGNLGNEVLLFQQGGRYVLPLSIVEEGTQCAIEDGTLTIYDFISGKGSNPINVDIQNGQAFYQMEVGVPNTSQSVGDTNSYKKLLFMAISAGARTGDDASFWGLIEGAEILLPYDGVVRTPEIPRLVLHDPPGDASYAWIEEGTTFSSFEKTQYENAGGAGIYVDATVGTVINVFGKEFAKAGVQVKLDLAAGGGGFKRNGYQSSITFTERFSTSSDPLFTGNDGDVYVGMATIQRVANAKVLVFDQASCTAQVQTTSNIENDKIATTFVFSEGHIKKTLLPQIAFLIDNFEAELKRTTDPGRKTEIQMEIDDLYRDSLNWQNIVLKNEENRNNAAEYSPKKNTTFSSGAFVERIEQSDSTYGASVEYFSYLDVSASVGARFETAVGPWLDLQGGVTGNFRHSWSSDTGNDTTALRTIGYHLEDNDPGDFFSLNIKRDKAFDTPVFDLFTGRSSCPYEDNTVRRDTVVLSIDKPVVTGVPIGGEALFKLGISNQSRSFEAREYQVKVVASTNPDGAIISLGGIDINGGSASFFINANQTINSTLSVEQGPDAANYRFALIAYPQCEYDHWINGGRLENEDTLWVEVNFETECSPVSINRPGNNWLINGNSNNSLDVEIRDYDRNNQFLENIILEYRQSGGDWLTGVLIEKSQLIDASYLASWDVTNLPEGMYAIRARANCSNGRGFTVSSVFNGIIDRTSIGPFGIPTPSDGFLRIGQLISVEFDGVISRSSANTAQSDGDISLFRMDDTTAIPFNLQFNAGNTRMNLAPTVDLFNMPDLKGVEIRARVMGIEDASGNPQEYPIEWAFTVNSSPVFWDPDSINQKGAFGRSNIISASLKNQAVLTKGFEIVDFPVWVTPSALSGSVLPNGEYAMQFAVDPTLPVGVYRDTVTAIIDTFPEYLDIVYESLATPPNWKVDPGKYTYSMSMILALSLDQGDVNLSRDDRDMVAAIFNGEIRGVGRLEYVSRFDKYMAFLTVYSDIPANEEISFSMWRASSGVEHVAKETFYFASEQVYGQINNPEILHTDGVFQVIPLQQGWNWVSLNVSNADMTIANLLNSLGSPEVGNNVTVKRKDGGTATFTQIATPILYGSQWSGNLQQLDNKQAYMIHLSQAADTLRVPGQPITAFSPIDLLSGWNWIGFQPQSSQLLRDALASVNLRNLDLIKGQNAFSQFHRGSNTWFGPLQFMEPGKGYKLRLKNGQNYNDLIYSRLGLKDFVVDHTKYESSMTLIASVGMEDARAESREERLLTEDRLLVGAFIDDTCRGYGFVEYVEFLEEYRVIFSLQGNVLDIGRKLTFKLYDTQSGQEFISDKMEEIYITDRILGEMREPFVLFERLELPEAGYFLEQNYPNPYDSKTTIRFILPQDEHVTLSVYDQFGKRIALPVNEYRAAGEHSVHFDAASLPAGVYHYTIQAGEFRASRKMVKF